jgi:hypothetical protein
MAALATKTEDGEIVQATNAKLRVYLYTAHFLLPTPLLDDSFSARILHIRGKLERTLFHFARNLSFNMLKLT